MDLDYHCALRHLPAGCDTLVATGATTRDGVTLFGKNSDREPNEAHHILILPAADHAKSTLKCTYLEVPQAEHTYAVLLAKPFWIWVAEMGVNEKGVAIGNEAVFTRAPMDKKPGLIGMDLLRLALERAATAAEAVRVIVELLEQYGQGGNCGYQHKFYYHNSFLIADPFEAWVLETAAKQWAAKKISGVYSISNGITIENQWDMASQNLVNYAIGKKWCKTTDFNFSACYSDSIFTTFSDCRKRRHRTMRQLTAHAGQLSPNSMMAILRDHDGEENYRPHRGLTGATVCMHAGYGPVRGSQTTGSMVCHLAPERPTIFVTATAAPCTSIYKPLWIDSSITSLTHCPTGFYDDEAFFWQHEVLHRSLLPDYATLIGAIRNDQIEIERKFVEDALRLAQVSRDKRNVYANDCFSRALTLEKEWRARLPQLRRIKSRRFLHALAWRRFNRKADVPV
ncbi:C69 family dipeptidase [candidate division KSB1 bacterium]|nr:C69 family dipeptidase [candidate division KSB1 bacterium]